VRQAAGLLQIVQRELRAVVAGVELLDAEVDGVGSVGEGGADGIETTGGSKKLWNRTAHNEECSYGLPSSALGFWT
jgi:hypothetical protein